MKLGEKLIPNFDADEEVCAKAQGVRVFIPLCGKTVDMAFLSKNPAVSEVVGVDGIRKALEEFAHANPETEVDTTSSEVVSNAKGTSSFERLPGKRLSLLKGDFFALDSTATNGKFEAIFGGKIKVGGGKLYARNSFWFGTTALLLFLPLALLIRLTTNTNVT